MIKVVTDFVKCSDCSKSKMNGFELFCTEFNEIINFDETLCTAFEEKEGK